MEIKIECSCGSRFKFDLEPVNGQSPTALACPNCNASWTEQANAIIAQSMPAPRPAPMPVPMAPAPPAPPAPAAPKLGLRISGHAPREVAAAPAGASGAPPAQVAPPPVGAPRHVPRVVGLDPVLEPEANMGNFGMGVLGAALGAAVGSGLYYLLFIHTSVRLKLLALAIGFLAGLGARWLSKDRSKELGAIVAVVALASIVGTQYLIAKTWFREDDGKPMEYKSDYEERVAEARKVVAAVPKGTEQEIRLYLAKEMADEGEKPDLKAVTRDDIEEFRTSDLPEYRALADGKISKEDYDKAHKVEITPEDIRKEKEAQALAFRIIFIALTLSKFNIACMIGAAGIGYKMTADA